MKNQLFNLKAVQTGAHKAEVGAVAETFESRRPEPKQIVSAPQHCVHGCRIGPRRWRDAEDRVVLMCEIMTDCSDQYGSRDQRMRCTKQHFLSM